MIAIIISAIVAIAVTFFLSFAGSSKRQLEVRNKLILQKYRSK